METIICNDGYEIEENNFEVENFDLIWTSEFSDLSGGGYDRVYFNKEDGLYLLYTNTNGFEGTWGSLVDLVEFFTPDDFVDEIYTLINDAKNNQKNNEE